MDPWSNVDYSRIIGEASMVEEKLLEVNPPSGRVSGRGMLALPILEARRRRNRGEITKKGSVFGSFTSWGATRGPGAPWRGPTLGRPGRVPGRLVVALWPHFGSSGSFQY